MIRILGVFSFLIVFVFSGCKKTYNDTPILTIATAASAQFALREIAANFEKENKVKIEIILGSSGKLTTQILNGAPYDIFFSANMHYPNVLFKKEKTVSKPIIYGYGIPVLWSMKDNIIFDSTFIFLANSKVERFAIANPKNAPYGEMAIQYLKDKKVYSHIADKLVYGESISQVNEYILNQAADCGISAKSIVLSPKLKGKGTYKELNRRYWIEQGTVIINNDNVPELKQKFLKYIHSNKGTSLLKKYGYAI